MDRKNEPSISQAKKKCSFFKRSSTSRSRSPPKKYHTIIEQSQFERPPSTFMYDELSPIIKNQSLRQPAVAADQSFSNDQSGSLRVGGGAISGKNNNQSFLSKIFKASSNQSTKDGSLLKKHR